MAGEGTLSFTVWPAYVGACTGEPTNGVQTVWEPNSPSYKRGQIMWALEGEQIVGRAEIHAPAGTYTHLLYFHHPEEPHIAGSVQLPHPLVFTNPTNVIDVYPITNADLELLKPYNT
jgi:hypothetical protein